MKTYLGTHGLHNADNLDQMVDVIDNGITEFSSITVIRVDTHYPPILDNGDTVCCLPNLEPGAISRCINALNAILRASEHRRRRNGVRVHPNTLRGMWAKEFSQSGKCHFHIAFVFNKQAYYYLGDNESEDSLKKMITKAWYSALDLELEDCPGLVHFPENCKYVLDTNSPDYIYEYGMLFIRLDYLTKLDTKIYEEGERNFGGSRK
ncbi:inovirus Gp2 family protein [Klebsiella aerogenes]|uniref:inovirus Gp2 family protein n=1 Tax=Enterobacterales TaxID=91347 RepID=UPI002FF76F0C